jgi:hypothetical protein
MSIVVVAEGLSVTSQRQTLFPQEPMRMTEPVGSCQSPRTLAGCAAGTSGASAANASQASVPLMQ